MKVLIVYDSLYGNTEKIARAIAGAFNTSDEVKVVRPGESDLSQLEPVDLFIVGSPTHAGRATKPIQEYLEKIPSSALKNIRVASFDTRLKTAIVKIFGFAANRIAGVLQKKGGQLAAPPQPFIVKSVKGQKAPILEDGELRMPPPGRKPFSR
jgi:flavodoxin